MQYPRLKKLHNWLTASDIILPEFDTFAEDFSSDTAFRKGIYDISASTASSQGVEDPMPYRDFEIDMLTEGTHWDMKNAPWEIAIPRSFIDILNITGTRPSTFMTSESPGAKRVRNMAANTVLGIESIPKASSLYIEEFIDKFTLMTTIDEESGINPFTGKRYPYTSDKAREEIRNKATKGLHKTYTDMANLKFDKEQKYVDLGVLDRDDNDFMTSQAYSFGMNLPFLVLGGAFAQIPKAGVALTTALSMAAVPTFMFTEGVSLAGEIYKATGEIDKEGRVIEGSGDPFKAHIGLLGGTLAGAFETVGLHQGIKLFKPNVTIAGQIGAKTWFKDMGRIAIIEGIEEGVYQNPIEQVTKMFVGVQKEYSFRENLDNFLAGTFGGLLIAAPGASFRQLSKSQEQLEKVYDYMTKEMPKDVENLEKNGAITQERANVLKETASKVNDMTIEEFSEAVKETSELLGKTQAENIEFRVGGEQEFEILKERVKKENSKLSDNEVIIKAYQEYQINKLNEFNIAIGELSDDFKGKESLDQGLAKVTSIALHDYIKSKVETTEEFTAIQEQLKGTLEEKTQQAHDILYKKNPEVYIRSILDIYLERKVDPIEGDVEIALSEGLQEQETKVADIEKRRLGELNKFEEELKDVAWQIGQTKVGGHLLPSTTAYVSAKLRGDPSEQIYAALVLEEAKQSGFSEKSLNELSEALDKVSISKEYSTDFDKINAKYDAELAALDITPKTKSVSDTQEPLFETDISAELKGSNIIPFDDPKMMEVTSTFDKWIDKQQGRIDLSKPFQVGGLGTVGTAIIEKFRQEYLAKNNFTKVPKERLGDFKRDWNNWLKENFGLRYAEGIYENYYKGSPTYDENNTSYGLNDKGQEGLLDWSNITDYSGHEVIISGNYKFKKSVDSYVHNYVFENKQRSSGLGWTIYNLINNRDIFFSEYQGDYLPDLFSKSVSSTVKENPNQYKEFEKDGIVNISFKYNGYLYTGYKGDTETDVVKTNLDTDELIDITAKEFNDTLSKIEKEPKEVEILLSGETRITDKDGTKYYNRLSNRNTIDYQGYKYWGNIDGTYLKRKIANDGFNTILETEEQISKEEYDKIVLAVPETNIKEITKQEFEAKKEELTSQSVGKTLNEFIGKGSLTISLEQSIFEDVSSEEFHKEIKDSETPWNVFGYTVILKGQGHSLKFVKGEYLYSVLPNDQYGKVKITSVSEFDGLKGNKSTIPVLENLYKRYWNIWLMHSFMYAKQRGHNEVWLPTGEAMYEIEGSEKTAAMYATKWDLMSDEDLQLLKENPELLSSEGLDPDERPSSQSFDKVGPYWTTLNKIKGIKLELAKPDWSTIPLIKADISNVDTEAYTLFETGFIQPTQKASQNFQGYVSIKDDPELKKGSSRGDAKDAAMRLIAQGGIFEVANNKPSSTRTSAKSLGIIDQKGKTVLSGNMAEIPKVVMLARNGALEGQSLERTTKNTILDRFNEGSEFVVGDMPNVDSQFIDYLQEIGAKFTVYHTGNKPRIDVKRAIPIQSDTQLEKVPQNASMEAAEQSTARTVNQKVDSKDIHTIEDLQATLKRIQGIDNSIEEFGEWVVGVTEGTPVYFVNENHRFASGDVLRGRKGAYDFNTNAVYINKTYYDLETNVENLYNTLVHEITHKVTALGLDPNPKNTFYNREFRGEVEAIYDNMIRDFGGLHRDFYNTNKENIDRMIADPNLKGEQLKQAKTKALQEFVAYMMSNTSVVHQWARDTELVPGTFYLKAFVDRVKAFFAKMLGNKPITYFTALETSLGRHFNYKYNFRNVVNEVEDVSTDINSAFEILNDLQREDISPVSLRNVVTMLNPDVKDWVGYIQGKTYPQFLSTVLKNVQFMKVLKYFHEKNQIQNNLYDYIAKMTTKLYALSNSLVKYPVVRLTINGFKSKTASKGWKVKNTKLEDMPDVYYNKNNAEESSYDYDIMLKDRIEDLNKIFGVEFTLVKVDDVKVNMFRYQGDNKFVYDKTEWKKINSIDFKEPNRNEFYAYYLAKAGIVFPGTWSDKHATIGFRIKRKLNVDTVEKFYVEKYTNLVNALLEAKVINEKQAKMYLTQPTDYKLNRDSYVVRTVMEDLRLGGTILEDGTIESALFDPENPESYDAIKIFKRSTDVSPLHKLVNNKSWNRRILSKLSDKTGIGINEEGNLIFDVLVVNNNTEETYKFNFKGEDIEINLKDLLLNEYGTEVFDGVNVHTGGWREVVETLAGSIKKGVIKGKILNDKRRPLFYDKGAYFKTKSPLLKKWMKANSVAMLVFDSAAKNNKYPTSNLLGEAKIVTLEFNNYYHDMEKDTAKDDGKGLVQSLIANFTHESNPAYSPKPPEVLENILNVLVNDFTEKMYSIDAVKVLNEVQRYALEGGNKKQSTIANIFVDYLYNTTQDKVVKAITDKKIAEEVGNAFLEPYVADVMKSYIRKNLQKIYNFQIDSTWLTLRPDMGWLESNVLDELWGQIYSQVKAEKTEKGKSLHKDLIKLMETIDITSEESTAEFRELVKQSEEVKQEIEDTVLADIKEETKKRFYEIIDKKTGRLKDGYTYLSNDVNDVFNVKIEDNVLSTIIPGSDLYSQTAPKVAMISKQIDLGSATFNSEYIQTKAGKDFDIDQILITPYTKKWFTKKSYKQYVNSANESAKRFEEEKLNLYRKVLEDPSLTSKSGINTIHNAEIHKKFMQKISSSDIENVQELFNPAIQSLPLLNTFQKDVGQIVNNKKIFTAQAQIGYTAEITILGSKFTLDPRKGLGKYSIVSSRLLNDAVDKPTNTNGFFYRLNKLQKYDIVYDMGLEDMLKSLGLRYSENPGDLNEQELQVYYAIEAIEKANKLLFGYGTKIASDYNLNIYGAERGINEDLTYIQNQQQINYFLETKQDLSSLNTEDDPILKEILDTATVKSTSDSSILSAINNIPLHAIPNQSISLDEYEVWQKNIVEELSKDVAYKDALEASKKSNSKFIDSFLNDKETANPKENKYLLEQFLATRWQGENTGLHVLKAQLIGLVNPVDQTTYVTTKSSADTYYKDVYNLANDYAFPKLFDALLEKRTIRFRSYEAIKLITPRKGEITLRPDPSGQLSISIKYNDKIHEWAGYDLANAQETIAKRVYKALVGKDSLFQSDSFKTDIKYKDPASMNRFRLNGLLSFSGNADYKSRVKLAKELLDTGLPGYNDIDKKIFWNSLTGYPKGRLRYPLNLIPVIADRFTQSVFQSQGILLELASKTSDKSGREFLSRYIPISSQTFPGQGFESSMRIKNAIEDSEMTTSVLFETDNSPEVISENISFLDKFKTIFGTIFDHPENNKITADGMIAKGIDLLNGRVVPIDRLTVTQVISSDPTNVPAKAVSLESIALTKATILFDDFKGYISRHNALMREVENSITALKKNYEKTDPLMNENKIITEINLLSENLPFKIEFKSPSMGEYIYTVDEVEYTSLNDLLTAKGITSLNDRYKYKAAIQLRTIYDLWNIKLVNNVRNHIQDMRNSIPKGFANVHLVDTYLKKWDNLVKQFESKEGFYFPRTYDEGVAEKLVELQSAYELIKKEHPKYTDEQILAEAQKRIEDVEFQARVQENKIVIDGYNGKVHGWMLKRKLLDWLVEGQYITDTLEMHERHMVQFFAASLNDINIIESLLYEHNAFQSGTSQKVRNQMKAWYGMIAPTGYLKSEKIQFRDMSIGDSISFYTKLNNKERHVRGILAKQTDNYIYLDINKDVYKVYLENRIARYHNVNIDIQSNEYLGTVKMTQKQGETLDELDIPFDPNWSVHEASIVIIKSLEEHLKHEPTWARYKKDKLYVKQYADDKIIKPNGVERQLRSPKLPNRTILGKQTPKDMDELFQLMQFVGSIVVLGTPGSGVRNGSESMWRTFQAIGFRRILLPAVTPDSVFDKHLPSWLKVGEKRINRDSWKFASSFKNNVKEGHLAQYANSVIEAHKLVDISKLDVTSDDPTVLAQTQILEGLVVNYLLKHGLGKGTEVGSAYVSQTDKSMKISKDSIFHPLASFRRREVTNRILGAYLFGYKAMFIDKKSNIRDIEVAIEKGVGRANSSYEMMYRKLVESTAWGRLLAMFSHFNTNQWDIRRMEIEQGRRTGQVKPVWGKIKEGNIVDAFLNGTFNLKSIFAEEMTVEDENGVLRTYKKGDSVDPLLLQRRVKEFIIDALIGGPMEFLYPGVRVGNPINRATRMALVMIADVLLNGDSPDEWDMMDWVFVLLGFKLGMGHTIPIQLIYNLATEKKRWSPINSKTTDLAFEVMKNVFDPPISTKGRVSTSVWLGGEASKWGLSVNVLPYTRKYQSNLKNKITSTLPIPGLRESVLVPESVRMLLNW